MTRIPGYELVSVDITDFLAAYSATPSMLVYYPHYPLREMIEDLLVTLPAPDETEFFYSNLNERIPGVIDLDLMVIENFIHDLHRSVDQAINLAFGKRYEYSTYSMKEWIDNSSILLHMQYYDIQFDIKSLY